MQIASSPLTAEPTIPTPGMRIAIKIHRKITVMLLIRAPKALIPVRERYHRRIHPPRRHNHHIRQVAVHPNAGPGRRVRPAHPPQSAHRRGRKGRCRTYSYPSRGRASGAAQHESRTTPA